MKRLVVLLAAAAALVAGCGSDTEPAVVQAAAVPSTASSAAPAPADWPLATKYRADVLAASQALDGCEPQTKDCTPQLAAARELGTNVEKTADSLNVTIDTSDLILLDGIYEKYSSADCLTVGQRADVCGTYGMTMGLNWRTFTFKLSTACTRALGPVAARGKCQFNT